MGCLGFEGTLIAQGFIIIINICSRAPPAFGEYCCGLQGFEQFLFFYLFFFGLPFYKSHPPPSLFPSLLSLHNRF